MSRQSTNTQMEKKMVLSSLLASELSSQTPQALESESTTRTRQRRRKKAKGDDEAKKRRLSDEQVQFLEMSFKDERKLESGRKTHLAAEAGLDPKQVAVWFQNRRARHKSKQVEEAYARLKAAHDAVVIEKCQLENQLMNLKEKLSEAEEEIRKLSLGVVNSGGHAERGCSPSSSFSTASGHQPFAAEFEMKGEDELVCMEEYSLGNYYLMDQWANFYGL